MKRVRGFGYVDDVDETEEGATVLEHGCATEQLSPRGTLMERYNCPRCNRFLFYADVSLDGIIEIRCRRCRRDVTVTTRPVMRRIGFINSQREEDNQDDC